MIMPNYRLLKQEGTARRGAFFTPHGTVQTPAFMNVATCAAIKGAVSAQDLSEIKCQVMLCNTYHLHVRPGDDLVYQMGGLHRFTGWTGPILTDSGGFQVFSLAGLRKIREEGVSFSSHVDGRRLFIGPEESMRIQSHLAPLSPWPSMNAWKIPLLTITPVPPVRVQCVGWSAATGKCGVCGRKRGL